MFFCNVCKLCPNCVPVSICGVMPLAHASDQNTSILAASAAWNNKTTSDVKVWPTSSARYSGVVSDDRRPLALNAAVLLLSKLFHY